MFPTLENARAIAKQKAGIRAEVTTFDAEIDAWLGESKALRNGVDEYRPYFVAAFWIQTNRNDQALVEASGSAKFRNSTEKMNYQPVITALFTLQARIDAALTNIPSGWDAQSALDALCGCEGDGEAVAIGGDSATAIMVI
jgi:hypothetical protein